MRSVARRHMAKRTNPTVAASEPLGERALSITVAVGLAALVLLAYAGSFDGAFVSDDKGLLRADEITSFDAGRLEAIFTTFHGANYMPVTMLSFAVDHHLWGFEPAGWHATNLLLHVVCAWLIYSILTRMGLNFVAAALVAAAWAIHPVQVESVAWISERKNVLSGVFFLAAFRVYLEHADRPRVQTFLGVLALYLLALFSKINTVVLPAVMLAYEWTFRFRYRRRDVAAALPILLLGLAVTAFIIRGSPIHGGAYHGGSAVVTWLSSTVVVFRYLGNIIWPVGLAPYYDVPLRGSVAEPAVALSILGLLGIVASMAWAVRRRRGEAFWMVWFGVTLAPMLNLVPFRALMHDRYLYLALVGPLAAAAWWLDRTVLPDKSRRAVVAACLIALAAYIGLTRAQVETWSSELTLYQRVATHVVVVGAHPPLQTPDHAERIAFLERQLETRPDPVVQHNLGALYYTAGRNREATELFHAAAALRPQDPKIMLSLARANLQEGQVAEARRLLDEAVRLAPFDSLAHLTRAVAAMAARDRLAAEASLALGAEIRGDRANAERFVARELQIYRGLRPR